MRGTSLAVSTALVAVLTLVGCSDQPDEVPSGSGSASVTLDFSGGEVPTAQRLDASTGEKIEIVVKADEAGELHVHTEPEEKLDYDEGTTTLTLEIDQPGVYEVESHDLEATVLQLEVS